MNNLIYRTETNTLLKLLVAGAACAVALAAPAQTNSVATTNQVPNLLTNQVALGTMLDQVSVSQDLSQVTSDLLTEIKAMQPFTTNGNATAKIALGENTASKNLVTALLVEVPVTAHTSIGAVGALIGGTPYEGGLNGSYGVTNNWFILGPVRSFVGDGAVYNFKAGEPANYSFTGFERTWSSGNWDFGGGLAMANTSDQPGVDLLIGVHATYWWSGRKLNP
jgi:hypothetical protein